MIIREEIIAVVKEGRSPDEIADQLLSLIASNYWKEYRWGVEKKEPSKYGKYFIRRKDGKLHWETWNGSGWAYNGKVITHWMEIKHPA